MRAHARSRPDAARRERWWDVTHAERERVQWLRREAIDNLVRAAAIMAESPSAEGDAAALVLAGIAVLKIAEASADGTHDLAVGFVRAAQITPNGPTAA
jgi:hypothetical protein